jgi:hypothetical protein
MSNLLHGEKMGNIYAQIINDFQPTDTTMPESRIYTDKIDMFLSHLTDIFVSILDNGYVSVDNENLLFENKYTKKLFIAGMTGLKQGLTPMALEITLDFLSSQTIREQSISTQELFEIGLLKYIIPILRPENDCIKRFIDFLIEFCSGNSQHFQIVKFIRFIDIYKLTDCYVLNVMKAL